MREVVCNTCVLGYVIHQSTSLYSHGMLNHWRAERIGWITSITAAFITYVYAIECGAGRGPVSALRGPSIDAPTPLHLPNIFQGKYLNTDPHTIGTVTTGVGSSAHIYKSNFKYENGLKTNRTKLLMSIFERIFHVYFTMILLNKKNWLIPIFFLFPIIYSKNSCLYMNDDSTLFGERLKAFTLSL